MERAIDITSLLNLSERRRSVESIRLKAYGIDIPRGSIIEAFGKPSSGKTSFSSSIVSHLTNSGEFCAMVDTRNGFDPVSASVAESALDSILWVKCGGDVRKAIMSADYLVQARSFGIVWLNLSTTSVSDLRLIPKSYWYRYRTCLKNTPTILLVTCCSPIVGPASQLSIKFDRSGVNWEGSTSSKLPRHISTDISICKNNTLRTANLTFRYSHA